MSFPSIVATLTDVFGVNSKNLTDILEGKKPVAILSPDPLFRLLKNSPLFLAVRQDVVLKSS